MWVARIYGYLPVHVQVHNIHEKLDQKLDIRNKHEVSLAA
jgi:hypothetical protein